MSELREALEAAIDVGGDSADASQGDENISAGEGQAPQNDAASAEPASSEGQNQQAESSPPPVADPASFAMFSQSIRDQLATLPPEAQAPVLERMKELDAEFTRKTQELAEQRKQFEPLHGAASQWQPYLQQVGVTPDQAFQILVQKEYALRTGSPEQKLQTLAQIAQDYGISLGGGNEQMPQHDDPVVASLRQEIGQLKQELGGFKQQQMTAQERQIQTEIDAFSGAKDPQGNPLRPHFAEVEADMVPFINAGHSLDEAYQRAIWANPAVREKLREAEKAKAETERKEAAEKARKTNSVNLNGASNAAVTPVQGTLRQQLEAAVGL